MRSAVSIPHRILVLLATMGLVLGLTSAVPASALVTFTVNSTEDQGDGTLGDGDCDTEDPNGECTLRAAVEEANDAGDDVLIVLPAGTYVLDSGDGEIDVTNTDHAISIEGEGADTTIIDGDGTTRIFNVVTDADLSIDGVTLRNATAASDGGAVYNGGTFTATNSTFRDNSVTTTGADGGALENDGTMTIIESSFINNSSEDESGAIDNDPEATSLTISGSLFEDNTAADGAGAIENEDVLTIVDSLFNNNRSEDDGGAIENNGGTLSIMGSFFEGNSTSDEGGAIDIDGGTVTITNTTFRDNQSDNDGGGAINNDDQAATTISGSLFETNVAGDPDSTGGGWHGGAIENQDGAQLDVENTTFRGNTAREAGGAIAINELSGGVNVVGTTLVDNVADGVGGAIHNGDGDLTVADGLFDGNESTDAFGGAIANSGDLTVEGSTFQNNTASSESGAIDNDGGTADISGSVFSDNASSGGGAIFNIGSDDIMTIDTSTFDGNTSDSSAGAVGNSGDLTVTSSMFVNNATGDPENPDGDMDGGGIWHQGSDLSVSATTLRDNSAVDEGGGIYNASESLTTVELRNVTLSGNSATDGGGYWTDAGVTLMTNVTISGNVASNEGGGIYTGVASSLTLSHVTIAQNTAEVAGGGIDHDQTDLSEAIVGHTLIAENSPENCEGDPLTSTGHNVTDDDSCELTGGAGDETDVGDAHISDLGDHGGTTETHALLVASPAIDVGEAGDADEQCVDADGEPLNEDQRGAPRPLDGDGSGVAFCDAGAFEFAPPESLELSPAEATNEVGTDHTVTATVTDTMDMPSESITVRFSVTGVNSASGSDVTDANGEATFTYTGSNAGDDTISAFADTDNDGTQDDGEPSDTATKTWQEPAEEPEDQTIRLWGEERWQTAVDISQDRFPVDGSADTVVLARGDDPFGYADALAGTPLSVCLEAPLLITPPHELLPDVAAEIQRVLGGSGRVILLGLTEALDEGVEQAVQDLGHATERIGGAERIATSIEVAERIEADCYTPDNVLIARGFDFADALTGGAAAASNNGVIVLNHDDVRDDQTEAYIDDRGDAALYALGGQIAGQYPEAEGLFGATRIETAVEVANEFFADPTVVGVARAFEFPDSLTGGAHIGERAGPMLLTHDASQAASSGETIAPAAEGYLCDNAGSIATAYIYGGVVAISQATEDAIDQRIQGEGC